MGQQLQLLHSCSFALTLMGIPNSTELTTSIGSPKRYLNLKITDDLERIHQVGVVYYRCSTL
jgi:hypothetical protein